MTSSGKVRMICPVLLTLSLIHGPSERKRDNKLDRTLTEKTEKRRGDE